MIVGAGDLIGASVFASAVANDQPTIDVMNDVGLDASAVGNHEFDKGWADLRDRVIGTRTRTRSGTISAANCYNAGTTTPALPEYQVFHGRRCHGSASSARSRWRRRRSWAPSGSRTCRVR